MAAPSLTPTQRAVMLAARLMTPSNSPAGATLAPHLLFFHRERRPGRPDEGLLYGDDRDDAVRRAMAQIGPA